MYMRFSRETSLPTQLTSIIVRNVGRGACVRELQHVPPLLNIAKFSSFLTFDPTAGFRGTKRGPEPGRAAGPLKVRVSSARILQIMRIEWFRA